MQQEIWKHIEGYIGFYMVSNFGQVKSLNRICFHAGGNLNLKGNFLKSTKNGSGYLVIQLNKNSTPKMFSIHRLIAMAFIPNPENKPQVNHINGIKTDNRLINLEWNTSSENSNHSYAIGLSKSGEKHYNSKLSKEKVSAIKRLLRINPKINRCNLANKVGVSNGVIYQIINKTTWKHVL